MNLWNQTNLTKMNGLEEMEEKDLEVVTGGFVGQIFDAVFQRRDPLRQVGVEVSGNVSPPVVPSEVLEYVDPVNPGLSGVVPPVVGPSTM